MSTEIIESAVNEAVQSQEIPQTEAKEPEQEAQQEPQKEAPAFDKKFENMKARLKNEKRELQYKVQQMEQELAKYKSQPPAQPKTSAKEGPQPDDFENYGDYLEARAEWKAETKAQQVFEKSREEQNQAKAQAEQQEYYQERESVLMEKNTEMASLLPDYQQLVQDNGEVLDSFNEDTLKVILEADNAPLALYTLAKEGKLEAFANLSPSRQAIELGRAEIRGEQYTKKPVTKAPAPIESAKGSGSGSKSLDRMTPNELREWLRS